MRLERIGGGFQVDAVALGSLLGVPAEDVQRLMREGRIASLCEEGQGEDCGRHRITFRYGANRVRLTVNDAGEVLLRTRTTVAPRPRPQAQVVSLGDSPADLTRRIEWQFHPRHRRWLDELVKLAEMVEDLHESDEAVPGGLHRILRRIGDVLEAHMQSAESVVFPVIRTGAPSDIGPSIEALCGDHARLNRDCTRIRKLSRDFRLPDDACTSWVTLYAGLTEFIDALSEHMRLERDMLTGLRLVSASFTEGRVPE